MASPSKMVQFSDFQQRTSFRSPRNVARKSPPRATVRKSRKPKKMQGFRPCLTSPLRRNSEEQL